MPSFILSHRGVARERRASSGFRGGGCEASKTPPSSGECRARRELGAAAGHECRLDRMAAMIPKLGRNWAVLLLVVALCAAATPVCLGQEQTDQEPEQGNLTELFFVDWTLEPGATLLPPRTQAASSLGFQPN